MKNVITATVIFEDKSFVDPKTNTTVEYTSCVLIIDGEDVHVTVKKEDKGLLRILRRDMPRVEN